MLRRDGKASKTEVTSLVGVKRIFERTVKR